jgi:hypothetical protein
MDIALGSTVMAAPGQVSCEVAGEAVILNASQGVYFGLDPIGARVWNLLREPVAVGDILDTLLSEYEVPVDQCQADLLELLNDLALNGLIVVHDSP